MYVADHVKLRKTHQTEPVLQAGAEIDAVDYRGKTALFHAVSNGHSSVTKFMLESGSSPNVKERLHGYTPLIEAAIEDQQLIVEALLQFVRHNPSYLIR